MIEERIKHCIAKNVETHMSIAETQTTSIANAALKLVHSLLNDGAIYLCGTGASHRLCQYFSSTLMHPALTDRPSLPVVTLSLDGFITSHNIHHDKTEEAFARQIQALGKTNDCLIILSTTEISPVLTQVLQTALERGMTTLALTGRPTNLTTQHPEILEICLIGEQLSDIQFAHFAILNAFATILDEALFGSTLELS